MRDSGYPLALDEITAIEFQGLMVWDEAMDDFNRAVKMAGLMFRGAQAVR
ncbi:MAG TPA: hypothetical protein VEF04_04650 [Blastocatellia bacterium]|nr:hypothetical protein [Blastocatellia bacterium]